MGEDGFAFAMKTCFRVFLLNPWVLGLYRVLDAGINQNLAYPFSSACADFDEPVPLAGLTVTSLSGRGIHTGSTTWTIGVGGPLLAGALTVKRSLNREQTAALSAH